MRVAHVITRLILGGAQENTLYNAEDLVRRHGDEVTLITGPAEGPEGDLFERARRTLDVRVIPELRRAIAPRTDWRAYRRLVETLRAWKPDVVHTHSSKAGILARAAAWKLRVSAIIHTIHGLPFHPGERWWKNRLYIAAERWAARRCHRILTVADAMTDQAVAAGVAPRAMFRTVYSGMEVETFLTDPGNRPAIRREFGVPDDAILIAKVARLFEFKGHDDAIDAVDRLLERHPKLHVLFVGGGIWRDRLERRTREGNRAGRFHFTGLVPSTRIPELLHAADLVVHASYREGLARVLPQALLAGKPAVSYDIDGAREVVLPGKSGFLAPLKDISGLAEGIDRLAADPDLRQRLGAAGRELCRERFRHETMTAEIRAVYESVLKR
jgi:glycosyltransferase involved in cell wall biosynthesis